MFAIIQYYILYSKTCPKNVKEKQTHKQKIKAALYSDMTKWSKARYYIPSPPIGGSIILKTIQFSFNKASQVSTLRPIPQQFFSKVIKSPYSIF